MLNFKKAGIFSRGSGQEDACEQEDQSGGVLAVWGSPGSGRPAGDAALAGGGVKITVPAFGKTVRNMQIKSEGHQISQPFS